MNDNKFRCAWPGSDEIMIRYHDEEWGVPVHDDLIWFEFIVLDAFQAGLSWKTVLHKREAFRQVFYGFDPVKVARMSDKEREIARQNPAIIRNRLKIRATVNNAIAFLKVQEKWGSFDYFIWSFTNGEIIHNSWRDLKEIPASTPLSDKVSNALKKEGFSFVGSTICYALLQASGVVNDHLVHCFRYKELIYG
ncbi:MAG: DNA-3-methyladenine glycosylase I [Desulfobacteraceae bacterium]|nr:DNA-3-methyladenine glycosylase I [Desulfobacteraceae bacterium]MDH3574686.1 DNA-3-methyladenine glycosylase I [Desulfobacteraceae bacterium]MDH3837875.1 DNA-3-methyladenine glycosylase I [Desulfobacteraceae bacterium]MDH3875319.1 DNA-3-methyladenine glycosylase I [Desulfobacteraceae bacterium]MDH3956493.1 DNA-3-methyladenine glycosylase I [Desulfobacteraceae bacterium]